MLRIDNEHTFTTRDSRYDSVMFESKIPVKVRPALGGVPRTFASPLVWSFLWIILLVGITAKVARSDPSLPTTVAIDWPLNDSGSKWTILRVPVDYYGPVDTIWSVPRKELIQTVQRQTGVAGQAIKLWASWPGMETPTANTPADFYAHRGSNTTFLLLHSGRNELQFRSTIDIQQAGIVCERPRDATTRSDLTCRSGTPLVQLPPEFDLKHRGLEAANKANSYRASSYNDIFYVPELGDALTTFIHCSDEENRPFENDPISGDANCEQIFIVPSLNATARVGYSREYLKDWRAIQQAWIRKLQSFED